MASKRYIVRASKRWLYKRRVPLDLVSAVGRVAWTQALGAVSEAKAEIAARALAVQHDQLIARLRALTPEDGAYVAKNGGLPALEEQAPMWERYAARAREVAEAVDTIPLNSSTLPRGQLAEAFMGAKAHATWAEKRAKRTRAVLSGRGGAGATGEGIAPLIPVWQRISQPRSAKVVQKMALYVRRFNDAVGFLEPKSVTRKHLLKFRDVVEAEHSRVTAIKHLEALHSLFNAALKDGVIDVNPAHGVKVLAKADIGDEGKKPFQAEHVRAIFKAMKKESADFQMLVKIIAYHGMRSGEAAQLRPEDVTMSMGVPVIRVHGTHGSIKNKASRREVPIHPAIRAELEAFARNAKGEWLFSSFPVWKAGRGAWFQRYASVWLRDVVGIKDEALTMHSFRHRFKTLAREIDMPEAVSLSLMGHTLGSGEGAKYGSVPSLAKRAEWIGKIDPLA